MRKDKFMDLLDGEEYSFFEQGGKIIIDEPSLFDLDIPTIPPGVVFRNGGDVYLDNVISIPKGTEFENEGHVYLQGVISLSDGIKFRNKGDVNMESLRSLDKETIFKNSGDLKFDLLDHINVPIFFQNDGAIFFASGGLPNFRRGIKFGNSGDITTYDQNLKNFFIEGIKKQRILNCMIKQIYG